MDRTKLSPEVSSNLSYSVISWDILINAHTLGVSKLHSVKGIGNPGTQESGS